MGVTVGVALTSMLFVSRKPTPQPEDDDAATWAAQIAAELFKLGVTANHNQR